MMLHPATVHFAIILPLVASVFGVIYLFTKTEGMSKISSRATLIAALAVIGVWYTGTHAGPLIYDYLSPEGKKELLEHKALGGYLAIAMGVIALLKLLGCKLKKFGLEALAVLLLLGATGTVFLQGKDGGEIVYEYGQPFQMYQLTNYVNNNDDLQMADDAEAAIGLVKKKISAISKETPAKIQNLKPSEKKADADSD
ncbi:DUF2231 domain-containing protein [Sulfurimonas sp. HSL-1716]|uniref:DUF2231 domain-containing protein n=1 Tax=Hydrocurvibacter sulfurireducens TaxID=3131937 RepID=UPI0031F72278